MSTGLLAKPESISRQIDDITRYQDQKNIYKEQIKESKASAPIYTDLQKIPLKQLGNGSKACLQIDEIIIQDITLISKKELDIITKPYLHKCDTMDEINTMVKKINNLYIEKAYVTSRAYIKPQDISKGNLTIAAMEGKIEFVTGKGIHTKLVYPFIEGDNLNLRDLEVGIEQLNRLQSMQATMGINPGEQKGYSQIVIQGKKVGSVVHGNLGVNNYGTNKSGKYQLSGSLGWDNPLGINDLLTLNLNTTNKQDKGNNSLGNSVSYALPVGRSYLEFSYSKFKYNQVVEGYSTDYDSKGTSETFQAKIEHKLFHNKKEKGKFDFSFLRKKNDNYLAGVFLDTSSNKLSIAKLGYTHNYTSKTWDGYATLNYYRGLDWFNATSGSKAKPTFNKFTLDLSYNKKFPINLIPTQYNLSFHGQYAKEGIIGSEQIGVGGPYSVRGFKNEGQLSGNKGFYIRNELSFNKKFEDGFISPYIGLDYGRINENKQSYGGHILGAGIGARIGYKNFSLDIFTTKPIVDSNEITYKQNGDEVRNSMDGFTGINLSFRF